MVDSIQNYEESSSVPYRLDLKKMIDYVNNFTDVKNLLLVEIGTREGGSAFHFSKYFKHVISVDPYFEGIDASLNIAEKEFLRNLEKFNNISKIRMKSDEAVNLFKDESIDILYIDGDHAEDIVTNDIKLWLPKIKENGFISGHDYYNLEGLTEEQIEPYPWYNKNVFYAVNGCLGIPEFHDGYANWLFQKKNIKK